MENGTGNPQPSWQHSAYPRANAAAEPGEHDRYNAYEVFPTADPNNHASAPFSNSSHSQWTDTTFGAGAAYNDGTVLPIAFNPYTSEASVTTGHSNNNTFAPFVSPNPSPFTEATFPAGAAYNNGFALPTASDSYSLGGGPPTGHLNNRAFAPLTDLYPSPFTGATFPAGAAYNGGIASPPAPMPYDWEAPAPTGPMDPFMGAGFQYPDPAFSMISPFTATTDTNGIGVGNNYQSPFPTTGFNTQLNTPLEATTDLPQPPHAAAINIDRAPQRPTCAHCGLPFTRKADLERHAKKHGDGGDKFFCAVEGCGYGSFRKDKLGEHVRRRHAGLRGGGVGRG